MNSISAVNNQFSGLYQANFLDQKVNNLINKRDTDNNNALNITEFGISEDVFDTIDTNGDGLADKMEISNGARIRSQDIVNENIARVISVKDSNNDGVLSVEEVSGAPEKIIQGVDNNGDGQLSKLELNIGARARIHDSVNERITNLVNVRDGNGDGVLGADEIGGISAYAFDRIDKNGDGQATRLELNLAARARIHDTVNYGISNSIIMNDSNNDGVLSADELDGVSASDFDEIIDRNGDGQADRKELNIAARTGKIDLDLDIIA